MASIARSGVECMERKYSVAHIHTIALYSRQKSLICNTISKNIQSEILFPL